ncbi:urokinase plasminogen activator surface receptor isoform X2 [Alexandromys fortis]|nr:urokinase plasminogen activator surface receptor isoform X2 [Microtus fortis]
MVKECDLDEDLCRTTVLREWEDDEELEVEIRDCAHYEKTNRTMSYRVNSKIISLSEIVCATDGCNRPRPGGRGIAFPRGRYLECMSCSSLDQSCERGREQSLQCRSPGEQCVEVVTLRSKELLDLQGLPPNGFQCYSCEGNSTHGCSSKEISLTDCRGPMNQCLEATGLDVLGNQNYTVRGCATASWCQGSHVADAFLLTHLNVSCCDRNGCNGLRSAAPGPGAAHLSLVISLLLTFRLWGVLLWT